MQVLLGLRVEGLRFTVEPHCNALHMACICAPSSFPEAIFVC
jgi:hypothetical protein